MAADRWGVSEGYFDGAGVWRSADPAVRRAIHDAMGAGDGSGVPPDHDCVRVLYPGDSFAADTDGVLRSESTGAFPLQQGDPLPADLAHGYHEFVRNDGRSTTLILTPGSCVLPESLKTWGWAVQLYAMRSANSWGLGDLGDLRMLADWSRREHNAGMVLVNPLHAATPTIPQQPSPYFPTSRCFRNPLYLRIEDVPGYTDSADSIATLRRDAIALNGNRRIDRDTVFRCKYGALEQLWVSWNAHASSTKNAFDTFRGVHGRSLDAFATFCAIAEQHPGSWMDWPIELRRPENEAVRRLAVELEPRVAFHAWLQWLVDEQLGVAGADIALMADLAIGVDRGGADSWAWQDSYALSMSVGAPPDDFNTQGQNWGLPPFDPWKLRDDRYDAFIHTVRSAFRHAGGVRIDHVMGLFRLYWIPEGSSAKDGCYVYVPFRDLLGIVALESVRAGAYVVGEDLGTVEDYVKHELQSTRIMSYRLSQFEEIPAAEFPINSLAAATTHDLATLPGFLTGSDLAVQQSLGLKPNVQGMIDVRCAMAARAGFPGIPPLGQALGEGVVVPTVGEFVVGVYRELATAPSKLITATLDDALGVEERPNMPGTVDEWPNWRIALPVPLEAVFSDPSVAEVAVSMRRDANTESC